MAGIWNINSSYNVNTKRITSKLSFEVGQNFVGRIVDMDKLTGDILLKLLDGWQFSAKLGKGIDILPEGLVKFQVEGFEDGKLQLKIVNTENKKGNTEEDTLEFLLKSNNVDVEKEDLPLLIKMVKHDMPLTKENISNVKTMSDFIEKLSQNQQEGETFIDKYIESKNIQPNSKEAEKIKSLLKGFFQELKSSKTEDILTFMENNIDLTEENIKSFNKVFKESSGTIYNEIKNMDLNKNIEKQASNENNQKTINVENKIENISENLKSVDKNEDIITKNIDISSEKNTNNTKENINTNDKTEVVQDKNKDNIQNKSELEGKNQTKIENKEEMDGKIQNKNIDVDSKKENISNRETGKDNITKEEFKRLSKNENMSDIEKIVKVVKEQISEKTKEMQNIIKTAIEQKNDTKSDGYNNIIQSLNKNMNDFKVFNSISNSYYYLDLPLNVDKSEYKCKLMIKDERKKGKKIDSTNVKIAASVSTNNMGIVDAYIKVNNNNMDVDIKCIGEWIKTLDDGKSSILKELSNIGYNVSVYVNEKKQEMNIVNAREFFEDENLGVINTRV